MVVDAVLVLAGLVVLARGADVFVVAASRLAVTFGLSPVVVTSDGLSHRNAGLRATGSLHMFRRGRHRADPQHRAVDVADEPSPVVSVDDTNFFDMTAGAYTVVDFWAPWCGPCRAFAPVFRAAAHQYAGTLRFGSCNVDDNPRTASLLGIMSIPTLVVFEPSGSEAGRQVGALSPRALEHLLAQLSQP